VTLVVIRDRNQQQQPAAEGKQQPHVEKMRTSAWVRFMAIKQKQMGELAAAAGKLFVCLAGLAAGS
jgi:hypothetical protein